MGAEKFVVFSGSQQNDETPAYVGAAHLALLGAACLLAMFVAQTTGHDSSSQSQPGASTSDGVVSAGQPIPSALVTPGLADPAFLDPAPVNPLLVNKDHPLRPLTYIPADLTAVAGTRVSVVAAHDLSAMIDAAAADGVSIIVASGYRSYLDQQELHTGYQAAFGPARAAELSAEPGHSEHQTGLAVDIADSSGECPLMECFAATSAGSWAAANAWKFGFIVRYPAGAEEVTGYSYEPWHLRHVGTSAAAEMNNSKTATLEAHVAQRLPPQDPPAVPERD